MGLAEKRALKAFQQDNFAKCVATVARLARKDVPIGVDWEGLGANVSADKAHTYWDQIFFLPLAAALEEICADGFGRDAVEEQLNRVQIRAAKRHVFNVTWKDGQIALDHMVRDDSPVGGPGTKTFKDRVAAIVGCLEENLG